MTKLVVDGTFQEIIKKMGGNDVVCSGHREMGLVFSIRNNKSSGRHSYFYIDLTKHSLTIDDIKFLEKRFTIRCKDFFIVYMVKNYSDDIGLMAYFYKWIVDSVDGLYRQYEFDPSLTAIQVLKERVDEFLGEDKINYIKSIL